MTSHDYINFLPFIKANYMKSVISCVITKCYLLYTKEYTWMDVLKRHTDKLGHQENDTITVGFPKCLLHVQHFVYRFKEKLLFFFNKLI